MLATGYCGIGAVKTHIGHLETAAGIAGVIKVLLCLQHQQLPGNLHGEEINPYIDLTDSPFYLVGKSTGWTRLRDSHHQEIPRRAGVSSFGFGGSNAHILLEEAPSPLAAVESPKPYYLVSLSAKTAAALQEKQRDLWTWLKSGEAESASLESVSYTLNVGRSHYPHRLAWVVSDKKGLETQLGLCLEGRKDRQTFTGVVDPKQTVEDDAIYRKVLNGLLAELKSAEFTDKHYLETLQALASLYVKGYEVDWDLLHAGESRRRIALPTYPFAKERYWVPASSTLRPVSVSTEPLPSLTPEEPLALGFYQPEWKLTVPEDGQVAGGATEDFEHLLVFMDDVTGFEALKQALQVERPGLMAVQVQSGSGYRQISALHYQVRSGVGADYVRLLDDLMKAYPGMKCNRIVDLWGMEGEGNHRGEDEWNEKALEECLAKGSYHLLGLSQALLSRRIPGVRLLHVYRYTPDRMNVEEMNSGFVRSLRSEQPDYFYQVVGVGPDSQSAPVLALLINRELRHGTHPQVRYSEGQRWIHEFRELKSDAQETGQGENGLLRQKGVYLITGGLGGLGMIFARHLAKNYQARLILTGRSGLDAARAGWVHSLEQLGGEALYVPADISRREEVARVLQEGQTRFGGLNGIIHAAGLAARGFIRDERTTTLHVLCQAKISGCIHLDSLTQDLPLDFMVVFSSVSAYLMNTSLVAYASANAFMDQFAQYREVLRDRGRRYGKTVSINWPLWAQGGMQIDEAARTLLFTSFGMEVLGSEMGIAAFHRILSMDKAQVMTVYGLQSRFQEKLNEPAGERKPVTESAVLSEEESQRLLAALHNQFIGVIRGVLKLNSADISLDEDLTQYGFDSILLTELSNGLNRYYQSELTPALFYQYPTVAAMTEYFLEHYPVAVMRCHGEVLSLSRVRQSPATTSSVTASHRPSEIVLKSSSSRARVAPPEEIAIIGMAGIFPGAGDIQQLWSNLLAGYDAISEFPAERLELAAAKEWINWGGFVKDMDKFDPGFFNISPREAELMDPQQRIFLQTVCRGIEDAGYGMDGFANQRCGVFVGVQLEGV